MKPYHHMKLSMYIENCCYSNCGCKSRMFWRVSKNSSLYGQLLHSLKVVYRAEWTTLAAIFISFNLTVSMRSFRIFAVSARRLNQLKRLYASACRRRRFALTIFDLLLTAEKSKPSLPSLIKFSIFPRPQ